MSLTIRRRASALALPGIPFVLLVGAVVSPTDSDSNAPQLRAAAAHRVQWNIAAFLELLTAALFPLAAVAVARIVRERGRGAATAGATLAGLGTIGMASIGLRHLFIYGLATTPQATALHVLDRIDHAAGLVILPCMFAAPFGLILLTVAAVRAGLVHRVAIVGAVLFFISDSLPIPAAEEIQGVLGLATFGYLAVRALAAQPQPHAQARRVDALAAAA